MTVSVLAACGGRRGRAELARRGPGGRDGPGAVPRPPEDEPGAGAPRSTGRGARAARGTSVVPSVVPTVPRSGSTGPRGRAGATVPEAAGASSRPGRSFIGGLVLVGAVAFGVGTWVGRRRAAAASGVAPAPPPTAPPPEAEGDVRELVLGLIGSHDLAGDEASRHHVEQTLRRAGVVALSPPPGSAVDTRCHEVVAVAATDDPAQVGLVVEVLRPGWARGPAVLRPAQVRVPRTGPVEGVE